MPSPLDVVHSLVLESGHRWGELATPEQSEDMAALLGDDGPRRHFWLRARGRSKSTDVAAASIAMLLAGGCRAGDELICGAAGRDQASLIVRKARGLVERTPELAGGLVSVERYKVVTAHGAALEVISSDLATSWGRTPLWVAIDEIANWGTGESDRTFAEALLTSLPKRANSRAVLVTTPSSPAHWSHALWQTALDDPLWRTSLVAGPAPWQDPAELESERRRLPDSLWRRLFACEWAAADDAIADSDAVNACVRHDGPLPPEPGLGYVIAFDLSTSRDHTAVIVAHAADEDGRRVIVADRVESWIPRGGQVDLADVEAWIKQASKDYNGAQVVGDPYQASLMIQRLRDAGLRIRPVTFSAGSNSRRAQMLMRLIRDRTLNLPDDDALRRELLSLRLTEGSTPGVVRLARDSSSQGHHDRATALMLAAEQLLTWPPGSVLAAFGIVQCQCGHAFPRSPADGVTRDRCPKCGTQIPDDGKQQNAQPAAPEKPAQPAQPMWPMPPQLQNLAAMMRRP